MAAKTYLSRGPLLAVIAWLLTLAGAATAAAPAGSSSFDAWAEHLAADWMRANPTAATASQYFSGDEQDALDRKLTAVDAQYGTPLEPAERAAYIARARAGLKSLRGFRREGLSPLQRVSAASLEWQLKDAIRLAEFSDDRLVFEQFRGQQVALVNFMTQIHPLRTPRDVENYLGASR